MLTKIVCLFAMLLPVLSLTGCGSKADTSVVAPPSDTAAREAAEAAYDKETAAANQ